MIAPSLGFLAFFFVVCLFVFWLVRKIFTSVAAWVQYHGIAQAVAAVIMLIILLQHVGLFGRVYF